MIHWGNVKKALAKVRYFVIEKVWDIDTGSLSILHSLGIKTIRVLSLVFKGFREDKCRLHAASLTFSTLMAIVPILALSLSMARVFGGDSLARQKIHEGIDRFTQTFEQHDTTKTPDTTTNPKPDITINTTPILAPAENDVLTPAEIEAKLNGIVEAGFSQVEKISFTTLGGIGLLLLLWMVISVLGTVESSFNTVWGISVGRPIWRKVTDYLSAVIILPFLVIMASSFRLVDIVSRFLNDSSAEQLQIFLESTPLKNMTVIIMTSLTFAFVIMFMPNTKVKKGPGLIGGIISAILFIGWLWLCATLQAGVGKYSKIYGSFAIVPIVLAWVYVSWQIVLFGAEVAFAVQNCATYRMEQGARRANVKARIILALSIVVEAAQAMTGNKPNFDISEYSSKKRIPVRFLHDVVDDLIEAKFMAEISESDGSIVLVKAPTSIQAKDIVDMIVHSGVQPSALGLTSVEPCVNNAINKILSSVDGAIEGITIADLLDNDKLKA
ncbi:MAG: YihY/virulence factor BrkB family protein [Kiritimatiellae bacterium]|nr:YihY/virulence factor BrkB family protein [Kiritimatiellia bacterium]